MSDSQELSLAGNNLTAIPPAIGRLRNLERLQVSGNSLSQLPEEIGELRCLEGLWAHGVQHAMERSRDRAAEALLLTFLYHFQGIRSRHFPAASAISQTSKY